MCVLAVIVVSEFQFRVRDEDEAVSGRPDLFVLLEVATYACVGAFVLLRFRPRPRRRRPDDGLATYALGYGFGCVLVLSAVYSPYLSLAVVRAGQVVVVVVLFTALMRHVGPGALHRVAHVYCVLLAAAVLFGVLVPFPRTTQPDRFTWLHVHPVQAGEMLGIAVVLLIAYLVTHRLDRTGPRWPLPVYLALLAACAGGIVATQTRGAVFGAVVGTAVVVWTRWRGSRKVEVGALGAVVLGLIALTSWHAIGEFVTRGESAERLSTLNARTELWALAMEQVARHPLYGSGLAASRGVFLEAMGLGGGHNALVNLLVDTGLVGGAIWLALLVTIGVAAARLVNSTGTVRVDGIIVLSVLCGMVANSVFTEELGTPANAAFTWLYLLLAWIIVARDTARHRDRPVL
ncbi:O-antigen ligase family protein [Haloechinothrix sp. YIM 98757]|uniref:O-antigen ligase family protein n=1 Tax=Haloechinothrix aidingensis TaxID=2752311 RepID=A0A838A414_9PSEU|nr:O-antigen ligase family protein [Haloechinothrix aidingensis]